MLTVLGNDSELYDDDGRDVGGGGGGLRGRFGCWDVGRGRVEEGRDWVVGLCVDFWEGGTVWFRWTAG